MAGHSKWAQIKHKKAVVDARRGKLFAKLIRGIEIAAREGNTSNPQNDMTLAAAVDRAKSYRVPAETIERAAKRGAGELGEDVRYERVLYEGYAPGGVAVLVETLTENRNRTGSDVRTTFTRAGANLGEPGSVAWMFTRSGLIVLGESAPEDEVLSAAAEAGADDIRQEDDRFQVVTEAKDLMRVRDALAAAGLPIDSAELTMLPQSTVPLDAEGAGPVLRLMDALEELDDVQEVFTNFDVPDEVLAEVS
ncbi:MAG TPA: YebC/PmpR family DNA-binding transcriptional regulator [Actinomycetota bacterium]|jgi:YebC/PmpR family DNA-binding regulatory protein|nr:YebC/PmpR family DNA-binding transcriptional regulator [Actinomycetota bacterium]